MIEFVLILNFTKSNFALLSAKALASFNQFGNLLACLLAYLLTYLPSPFHTQ